jgi:hypothetical protein
MKGQNNHFVEDGAERAAAAVIARIRDEVELEYAERLNSASWFERWRLYREIRNEVSRRLAKCKRLDEIASPRNLYSSS